MNVQFYHVVDRMSSNPAMSANGGDYDFGRTVAVRDGKPVGVRFWTSADFEFCPHSGTFNRCDERCEGAEPFDARLVEGWENGELLEGEDADRALYRFDQGDRFFLHFS